MTRKLSEKEYYCLLREIISLLLQKEEKENADNKEMYENIKFLLGNLNKLIETNQIPVGLYTEAVKLHHDLYIRNEYLNSSINKSKN